MQCPECETENPEEAKFCFNCAFKFSEIAEKSKNKENRFSKYIPDQLLKKIQASSKIGGVRGERRIVSILFCDIQGSTTSAESMDPEDWADIMNEVFDHIIPPVYEYEGIIARLMGDAILAFFGAPISHEDDPERAVLAAMKMIEQLQMYSEKVMQKWNIPLNIRVGINTGLVVVGEIGSDLRVEYTAMGDAINIASRMESTANPGRIRVTDSTFKHISYLFTADKIGLVSVKGRAEPLIAYEISGKRKDLARRRSDFDLNFVGREKELDTIQNVFSKVLNGSSQVINIVGEAGIGKSRLVREFQNILSMEGLLESEATWLETSAFSYQQTIPFVPFIDLLHRQIGIEVDMDDDEKWDLLTKHIQEYTSEEQPLLIQYLGVLLGLNEIHEVALQIKILDPPILQSKIIDAFQNYLYLLENLGSIILVIDDIQWLDDSSIGLLKQLLDTSDNKKQLFLLLQRVSGDHPDENYQEFTTADYHEIKMEPFDQSKSELLIANLLKSDNLPTHIHQMINEKAEGNPFFVSELVRGLIDDEQIIHQDSTWIINPNIDDINLPDTLTNLLMTRLDSLSESSKYVAQSASVIGRQFYYKVLDCLTPSIDLSTHLSDLEKKEWIISDMSQVEQAYLFKHVITKEVAYNSLLKKTRRELHVKIAECLRSINENEIDEIAHHFLEAKDYKKAVPYVLKSATKARISNANQNSLVLLQKIEPVVQDFEFDVIHDVYVGLGETYAMLGQLDESQTQYETLLEKSKSTNNEHGIVSALNKLARNMVYNKNNMVEADEFLTRAEEISARLNFKEGLIETSAIRCAMFQGAGDLEKAEMYEKKGEELVRGINNPAILLDFKHNLTISLMLSHKLDEANAQVEEIIELATKHNIQFRLSTTYGFLLPYIQVARNEFNAAKASIIKGYELATKVGVPFGIFLSLTNLGDLEMMQGYFEKAYHHLKQGKDASIVISYFGLPAMIQASLLVSEQKIGLKDPDQLEEMIQTTLSLMKVPYGDYWGANMWTNIAYVYLTQSKFEEASKYIHRAIEHVSAPQLFYHGRAVFLKLALAIIQGNIDEAYLIMKNQREILFSGTYKQYRAEAYLADAIIQFEMDKYSEGLSQLQVAEQLAEDTDRVPLLWQIHHYRAKYTRETDPDLSAQSLKRKQELREVMLHRFETTELRDNFIDWLDGKMIDFDNYELVVF